MRIHDVHRGVHTHKKRNRVGRGPGSGHGKTSGRGGKGQTARTGWNALSIFQGGAMPLVRAVPKRGFHNRFAKVTAEINVAELAVAFQPGEEVTPAALLERRVLKRRFERLKVLGDGELSHKLRVAAHGFSASARQKIEAAGGECVVIPGPKPVARPERKSKSKKTAAAVSAPAETPPPAAPEPPAS